MTNHKNNLSDFSYTSNKKVRGKQRSAPTLGDYMGRLPLLQQLSQSQKMLVKLSPSWQDWLNNNLSSATSDYTKLSHYADGQLLISCDNATIASQIKHLKTSLIEFFNRAGFENIRAITIRIEQPIKANADTQGADTINQAMHHCQPSSNAIKSIHHCGQSVKSESLSAALQRLEETLKNN